ncbi:MAG: discoidin domain-containing protein [Prevotellaceae bacterium]|jgi:hypothetical protein|nr:discoidin domain-containing protein [Prevotellaceae bacterium]
MKRILYLATAVLLLAFASCKDDSGVAPQAFSELSYSSDYGAVIITYKVPVDSNFYYVDVDWTDAAKKPRRVQASVYAADAVTKKVDVTCDGFSDTHDYVFTLTPYSFDGTPGQSQSITGHALPPAYEAVLETIEVSPGLHGAVVTWTNATGKNIQIEVRYTEGTQQVSKTFNAPGEQTDGQAVIQGLAPGNQQFVVLTKDSYNNVSEEKSASVTVIADLAGEALLDRNIWSVPGYNPASNNATIGYSSQAVNDNGEVVHLFDDNLNSFWHSSWSNPDLDYPHWLIIDLGREQTISRVEMCKRQGSNTSMQKGYQLQTCTTAGTNYPANNVNPTWTWTEQGTFSFDPTINDMQSVHVVATPRAQYLRIYFPSSAKGTSKYAMVGELKVYGKD